jgi:hypothetical protein
LPVAALYAVCDGAATGVSTPFATSKLATLVGRRHVASQVYFRTVCRPSPSGLNTVSVTIKPMLSYAATVRTPVGPTISVASAGKRVSPRTTRVSPPAASRTRTGAPQRPSHR